MRTNARGAVGRAHGTIDTIDAGLEPFGMSIYERRDDAECYEDFVKMDTGWIDVLAWVATLGVSWLGYTLHMTTARSSQVPAVDAASVAWERRRRAAWIDYLRVVREVDQREYEAAEGNAWETLQRRLRRNDELLEEQRAVRA